MDKVQVAIMLLLTIVLMWLVIMLAYIGLDVVLTGNPGRVESTSPPLTEGYY